MPRPPAVVAVALLPLLFAAGPATKPAASQPASMPGLSDQAIMAADYALLPRKPAREIGGLLDVRLDADFLHVTGHDLADGVWVLNVTGWPGLAQVNVLGDAGFHFQHFAFDAKGDALYATHVQVHTDYVQIARDYESGQPSVQLIQSRQFAEPNDDPVKLLINGPAEAGPNERIDLKLSASTFAALCREQPLAVRTYLLPVFRDLGAAAVLRGGDLPSAYQVLAADLPADAALAKRVDVALARLADAEAGVRAKAEDELKALGPAGAAELRRRDRSAMSPDVQATVDTAIRTAEPLDADTAAALATNVPFLIDALGLGDNALAIAAAKRLKTVTGQPIDLPPGRPAAERDRRIADFAAKVMPTTQPTSQPVRLDTPGG